MKKVLCLPRYERNGSSSRVRFYQFVPYLNNDVNCSPLLGESYINKIYSGVKPSIFYLLKSYVKRVCKILSSDAEILWVEKELFPFVPFVFERLFYRGKKLVVDYDDATFHVYNKHSNSIVRNILGKKISHVMRSADVVIAGNTYIANYAKIAGAKRIEIIPSVIDLNRYSLKESSNDEKIKIGWIGSPSSQSLLENILPALDEISKAYNTEFLFVGTHKLNWDNSKFIDLPWSEESEVESIKKMDIGIMPVEDKDFHWGKCGFKLIQYMACGLPIVGSPIGVNSDIIIDGENGYSATSKEDWVKNLELLILDKEKS